MDNSLGFLSAIEIFSLLRPEEIDSIASVFSIHEINEGEVLFREGDEGNELFIVKSGAVASSIRLPDGSERQIAQFNAGNFFGEMSIFEKAPRSATCRSLEKSTLLGLQEKDFFRMIEENPDIATKIMYRMLNITAQRLRDTGEFLSDMVHWGEAARRRAITDELTGAYNRRFLDDALVSQIDLARNTGKPLALVMVDLDYFREINENYGHEAGDRCIIEVVRVFNRHLRDSDILARFGGDEFTVLMPDTAHDKALETVERARRELEGNDLLARYQGPVKKVTMSIGVASFPAHADDVKKLKELADQALYRAKEGGRNRVVGAGS